LTLLIVDYGFEQLWMARAWNQFIMDGCKKIIVQLTHTVPAAHTHGAC
jgi:hypothetical protein